LFRTRLFSSKLDGVCTLNKQQKPIEKSVIHMMPTRMPVKTFGVIIKSDPAASFFQGIGRCATASVMNKLNQTNTRQANLDSIAVHTRREAGVCGEAMG